jgi:hypothetical protein
MRKLNLTPTTQLSAVVRYLTNNIATATMISEATGIPQKNICRYKRLLQKRGLIREVARDVCEITGCHAWYLCYEV